MVAMSHEGLFMYANLGYMSSFDDVSTMFRVYIEIEKFTSRMIMTTSSTSKAIQGTWVKKYSFFVALVLVSALPR